MGFPRATIRRHSGNGGKRRYLEIQRKRTEMTLAGNTKFTRRFVSLVAAVVILLATALTIAWREVGRWLVNEDPLSSADVIVVLSGGMPYRAEEAANVFRMGRAAEVWVSRPESRASELKKLGISFVGEEEYNRQILVHEGVPQEAIRILPDVTINTEQELLEVARQMRQGGKSRAIIVTSPEHTRRVGALWKKLVGKNPMAAIHAAPEDPFDPEHWWRNTRDALAVEREILGLMNVWAGLPVRPHSN
jgi:uncharacterized SAM-binding protein YcdF (DUF218 family)